MRLFKQLWLVISISVFLFNAQPLSSANKVKQDPTVGFNLKDIEVFTLNGKSTKLSKLWQEKPVLIITGSLSCPFTRKSLKPSYKLVEKFSDDFHIAMLYVIEAHPKGDISPYSGDEWIPRENFRDNILIAQPRNLSERTDRANELNQLLNLKLPVFIDDMENQNWTALGKFPNAGILINTQGQVIYKQKKFKARIMAKKMKTYIKTGAILAKNRN